MQIETEPDPGDVLTIEYEATAGGTTTWKGEVDRVVAIKGGEEQTKYRVDFAGGEKVTGAGEFKTPKGVVVGRNACVIS